MLEKVCEYCNKIFYTSHPKKKFCSIECKQEKYKQEHSFSELRNCRNCGKSFVASRKTKYFCCGICGIRFNRQPKKPRIRNEVFVCKNCNKSFTKHHGNQKFCKKDCLDAYKKKWLNSSPPKSLVCPECNLSFLPDKPMQVFCSENCRNLNHKKNITKQNGVRKKCLNCGKEVSMFYEINFCSSTCYTYYKFK